MKRKQNTERRYKEVQRDDLCATSEYAETKYKTYASEKRTTSLSVGMSALAAMSGAVRALMMAPATACRTLGSARTAVCIHIHLKQMNWKVLAGH